MLSIAEAGRELLLALSDEQLARYGEIARDQARAELRNWMLQAVLGIAAIGMFVWSTAKWGIAGLEAVGVEATGLGGAVIAGLLIGLALAYSPYRRVRNWSLWRRHCKAVTAEQARRQRPLQQE